MTKRGGNDRSQDTDTERGAGILTEGQREYLRGNKEFEHAQSERDVRYKIRERLKNALIDFEILAKNLEPRDREQLFKDMRPVGLRGDRRIDEEEIPREDELAGLVHAVAFLYKASKDADVPFERMVELGVREAKKGGRFSPRKVNVTIEEETELDYESIFDKIEKDEPLTEFESIAVSALVADDFETYVDLCRNADVDVKEKLESGNPLSVAESYVLIGLLSEEDEYRKYDLNELVHEDVRSALGPR